MIKKSVKTEIDTKEASLTPKEASLQSSNVESVPIGYCENCKKNVKLIEKMFVFLCEHCRTIVRYR
jgi:hypothetical protein